MGYNPRDHFFKKAKEQNYAARSVFKLEEIDHKLKIFQKARDVLDLGCSPGSWSQYASQKVGPQGRVVGLDLQPVKVKLANALFLEADLRDLELKKVLEDHQAPLTYDVVLSDMAPKTTGIRFTDQARSMELCELALNVADLFLKPKGHFICKLFHSDEFQVLREEIKKRYQRFEAVKPESTRSMSKEIFLVGLSKKG